MNEYTKRLEVEDGYISLKNKYLREQSKRFPALPTANKEPSEDYHERLKEWEEATGRDKPPANPSATTQDKTNANIQSEKTGDDNMEKKNDEDHETVNLEETTFIDPATGLIEETSFADDLKSLSDANTSTPRNTKTPSIPTSKIDGINGLSNKKNTRPDSQIIREAKLKIKDHIIKGSEISNDIFSNFIFLCNTDDIFFNNLKEEISASITFNLSMDERLTSFKSRIDKAILPKISSTGPKISTSNIPQVKKRPLDPSDNITKNPSTKSPRHQSPGDNKPNT